MRIRTNVDFLKWAFPRLGLAWPGYRRVHRQVWKRIAHRIAVLHLEDVAAYRTYLDTHEEEWTQVEAFCRIPISRFYRDRAVFDCIAKDVLPSLAEENAHIGRPRLLAWSAGCAAGEEPYSLNLIWKFSLAVRYPSLAFSVIATDADEFSLTRARMATYRANSLKELPARWIGEAFEREGALYRLKPEFQDSVEFRAEDLRSGIPRGPFDLVLCRNLAFTYFDPPNQRATALRLFDALRPGGALVIGRREKLPEPTGFVLWGGAYGIYRRPTAP